MNFVGLTKVSPSTLGQYGPIVEASFPGTAHQRYLSYVMGDTMDGFRRSIADVLAPDWIEVTAGISWGQYRAMDLYFRMQTATRPPSGIEAWYLGNVSLPPMERIEPDIIYWWAYGPLTEYGQRDVGMQEQLLHRMRLRARF